MGFYDLAIFVFHQVGAVAMQHTWTARAQGGRVPARGNAIAGRFDTMHLHLMVIYERIKQSDGIGTAANTSNQHIRQAPGHFQHLWFGFAPDDGLKIPHHGRIGMWTRDRANDVERVVHIRHPITHGLVKRVFKGLGAGLHRHDRRAEQFHAQHIGSLSGNIHGTHVNNAFQAQTGSDRCRCHAMLPGSGFGNNPCFAHALSE